MENERDAPFLFRFSIPSPPQEVLFISPRETAEESTAAAAAQPAVDPTEPLDNDAALPAFLLLPTEVHNIIAASCPTPSDAISLSRTCRRLYGSIGPSNHYLWYNIRYRTTERIEPNNVPQYSQGQDYYRACLDILCNRVQNSGCQRCLGYDFRMYCPNKYVTNDGETFELLDLYVAKVFHGTWCSRCTREMFQSVTLVQQETPIPNIPSALLTEMREHLAGVAKPGYFVSRSGIAKAAAEQCPNGSYSNFYIHRHPQLETDVREVWPQIFKTLIDLYKRDYRHLHALLPPLQLGKDLKARLKTKLPVLDRSAANQDALLDSLFELGNHYLSTRNSSTATKNIQRLEACSHFLKSFFGQPSDDSDFKMQAPTTVFLVRLACELWTAKMKEMGQWPPIGKSYKLRPSIDGGPKQECKYCTKNKTEKKVEDGSLAKPTLYSPVLHVFHITSQHPEKLTEDWLPVAEQRTETSADVERPQETMDGDKTKATEISKGLKEKEPPKTTRVLAHNRQKPQKRLKGIAVPGFR
ncbi:hypothetical protein DRE_00926 [Drechslerella stenobrocha 248]|uniref:F-box domain-containing protein n=1 Tax=Drechslerella stenobrocha 248 TaxID=1043628 RepID=W7HXL7_9PEZI|nr:hypothetical protein DRE_00926 [Drechslerella stenobrocha 248]